MNIREATIKAIEKGRSMTRTSDPLWENVQIKPTNTPACCELIFVHSVNKFSKQKSPRWNPSADDLIADDWEVV